MRTTSLTMSFSGGLDPCSFHMQIIVWCDQMHVDHTCRHCSVEQGRLSIHSRLTCTHGWSWCEQPLSML